jgi:hypothetical protein
MKLRFVSVLLVCGLSAILDAPQSAVGAAPAALQTLASRAPEPQLLVKTGSGCGWDYPCPPEPEYRRPAYRSGQVTIHNNYGSVNVYPRVSRRPRPYPPAEPAYCSDDPCRYGCGGYPCTDKCGTFCWIRRLRQGYCGHGCQSYREQARVEAEEKAAWKEREEWRRHQDDWMYEKRMECAPPNCVPDYDAPPPPPPPPSAYYYERAPVRDYARPPRSREYAAPFPRREPSKPDLTPRERFDGPKYPAK